MRNDSNVISSTSLSAADVNRRRAVLVMVGVLTFRVRVIRRLHQLSLQHRINRLVDESRAWPSPGTDAKGEDYLELLKT